MWVRVRDFDIFVERDEPYGFGVETFVSIHRVDPT